MFSEQGKSVVNKTIAFQKPGRIALAKGQNSDIAYVHFDAPMRQTGPGRRLDEWGCVWQSLNPGQGDKGQVVEHPLADWDHFDRYVFPDPYINGRFSSLPQQLEKINCEQLFIVGSLGQGPMHMIDNLRGFENYLVDLLLNPTQIEAVLDGIFLFLTGLVKQYAAFDVDAVIMADDQAMQSGPLFSMDLWVEYFQPRYKQLFDLVHNAGMKAYMHTCGHISRHLPLLHQCGVDIIDNKQPELWMHSDEAQKLKGIMTYSSCIDIQARMHAVELDEIDMNVKNLIQTLATEDGGFIGTYYNQPDLKIPEAKNWRMLQAFQAFRWD